MSETYPHRPVKWLVLPFAAILLSILMSRVLVYVAQHDWHDSFRPAALALLHGNSPYIVETFYNPPWTAFLLIPLAALPETIGSSAYFITSIGAYIIVLHRFGARLITFLLWVFLPPVMMSLYAGQLEWLVLLGILLPPRWGLFLVMIKPQVGGGLAAFWAFKAWKDGGVQHLAATFLPIGVVTLISFVLFGFWPERGGQQFGSGAVEWNASLWPLGALLGLVLLLVGMIYRAERYALAASPLLSVYTAHLSYTALVAAFAHRPAVMLLIAIILYLVW